VLSSSKVPIQNMTRIGTQLTRSKDRHLSPPTTHRLYSRPDLQRVPLMYHEMTILDTRLLDSQNFVQIRTHQAQRFLLVQLPTSILICDARQQRQVQRLRVSFQTDRHLDASVQELIDSRAVGERSTRQCSPLLPCRPVRQ
jgi:hypothetical protein